MIRLLDVSQPRHLLKTRVSNQRYEPEGAEEKGDTKADTNSKEEKTEEKVEKNEDLAKL